MFGGVDGQDLYNMTSLKTKNESSRGGGWGEENPSLANPLPSYPLPQPCIDNAFRQMDIPFLPLPPSTFILSLLVSFITQFYRILFFFHSILFYLSKLFGKVS